MASPPTEPPPGRGRRWLFRVAAFFFVVLQVELFSFASVRLIDGRWFTYKRFHEERRNLKRGDLMAPADPRHGSGLVLHPYLGYVYDPRRTGAAFVAHHGLPVSSYGFIDDAPPLRRRAPGKAIVGITGGSVAYFFSVRGWQALAADLAKLPDFAGKELEVVRLGLGGYKQPQQLMTLSYLLSIGAELDLLISIDGFNEVAFAGLDGVGTEVHPVYPRGWPQLALEAPTERPLVGEIVFYKVQRQRLARAFSGAVARRLVTANLVWRLADRALGSAIARLTVRLTGSREGTRLPYQARGPQERPLAPDEGMAALVAIWERSSRATEALCKAHGIRYLHVLQPNQYLPDSHTFGADEKRVAYRETHPYRKGAAAGYPLLRAGGQRLAAAGVPFADLTMVFATTPDAVYSDDCCHYTDRGYELLAHAIAAELAK